MSSLRTFIKQKLEENNLSINELERIAGLKRNSVHNILYGRSKNPKKETLESIAKILKCSVKEILLVKYEDDTTQIDSLPKGSSSESNPQWDPELYLNTVEIVSNVLSEKTILPPTKKIHALIWEIYLYTVSYEDRKIDPRFVEWIINKSM